MKSIFTIILICAGSVFLVLPFHALGQQPWMKGIKNQKNPNFYEVQQAFNNYWKEKMPAGNVSIPRGQGYKQYKRWEWFWEPRVGKDGKFPDPAVVMQEWKKYQATHPNAKKLSPPNNLLSPNDPLKEEVKGTVPASTSPAQSTAGGWVALGPSSSLGGYAGVGRLSCIAFHPTDANTFWVGSPAGGLWKTTTGGTSWVTLTDNLPVLGVSAVAIDPANPNNMYISTGDDNQSSTYAVGVLKSTNGGASWSATGLSYEAAQGQLVADLILHPGNPLILLAATSTGIYRTTNGGTTWTLQQAGCFQEILFKPGNPNTVYASASGNPVINGAQIFRSMDNGVSWFLVTSFSSFNRIALAVTPANPSLVGALCSDINTSGFGGYYTSTNSGASFNLTYAGTGLNLLGWSGGGDTGGQGWYDLCLAISPVNANEVYTGGINTWKSTNGGSTWAIITQWFGGSSLPTVHADKHYMAFSPLGTNTLYQCNDGGLYKTSDGGATWTDLSNGLQVTQFYRLGVSATNASLTLGGSQDNGTKLRTGSTYTDVLGGDGMEAIIDYSNANVMYASMQNGDIHKSIDGGVSFWRITGGALPAGSWVTPYVLDPVNPQVLYVGLQSDVYKSTNGGDSWVAISNSLIGFDYFRTLAVAASNTQVIYTTTDYQIYKTTTGGGSWSTLAGPGSTFPYTSLEVHPTNPQIVWVTCSGYAAGQKVFRTDNGGASWTNISGTLPNLPANTIEYDKNTGVLYLGNDVGVFVRSTSMTDWQVFDAGLPNTIVTELEIQYSASRIRAATYGRGLWESDLYGTPVATYCVPVYNTGCTTGHFINNFSLHTLVNNNSGCSNATGTGYTNYAPAGALTTTVNRGQSYPVQVQAGSGKAQCFGVWIDYNGDKDFSDAGELVYASPPGATTLFTGTIPIPAAAAIGPTRMRVRSRFNGTFINTESCSVYTNGETEDYTITIAAPATAGTQWNIRFGGSDADNFTVAAKTSDGGALLGGFSASPVSSDKTQASQGGQDFWILKVSSTGTRKWDKRFGGPADDFLNAITPTSDGGFLLGGNSLSGLGGDKTQAGQGGRDYWIVKITSTGTQQWDKRFGGTADEEIRTLIQLATGEYILAGFSASGAGGDKSESSRGGRDYWVMKLSSTGTKLWDKRFGGSGHDNLEAALPTTDGGFLLGGRSASGISGDRTQASLGGNDFWIIKISSTGTRQWDKRYGGAGTDDLYAMLQTSDGSYLLAGNSDSGISADKTQASQGGNDFWIVNINSTGTRQWDKRFGGSATDELRSLIAATAGGYLLGGRSASGISGDKSQTTQGLNDYWVVKITGTGAREWDKRFGGTGEEDLRTVLQTADGGYLLAGRSDSGLSGDKKQGSRGLSDYWIVKVGSTGTAAPVAAAAAAVAEAGEVEVLQAEQSVENAAGVLVVKPNPFTNTVRLQFTLARREQVSLKVYDAQGAEVAILYKGEAAAGKPFTFEWHAGHQKAGVYIVQLVTTGKALHRRVVLHR